MTVNPIGRSDREERIRIKLNTPFVTVFWHSISCVCSDCLDADAGIYLFGESSVASRIDTDSLSRSKTSRCKHSQDGGSDHVSDHRSG